jgi:hypothetical protein
MRGLLAALASGKAPDSRWKILTILGALSTRGVVATMTIEETTDGDIFLAYLLVVRLDRPFGRLQCIFQERRIGWDEVGIHHEPGSSHHRAAFYQ